MTVSEEKLKLRVPDCYVGKHKEQLDKVNTSILVLMSSACLRVYVLCVCVCVCVRVWCVCVCVHGARVRV